MTQKGASGAEANEFGHKAAELIAQKLGAKKLGLKSNEFELKGRRVTIRMARLGNNQVGVLYAMLARVESVIGAFEVMPKEYELLSLSPGTYQAFMRDSRTGKGKVGLVTKKVFDAKGCSLGRVALTV